MAPKLHPISSHLLRAIPAALLLIPTACQPVEISRTKPWWEESSLSQKDTPNPTAANASPSDQSQSITAVTENPDGSLTLNSPLPVYLINHLYNTLLAQKYDLLYDQLISEKAKQTYRQKNRNPREIIDWFKINRRDVVALLTRMNRGFNSTDVVWEQQGDTYRLQLTGRTAQGMRFTIMDITREGAQFHLVLIK